MKNSFIRLLLRDIKNYIRTNRFFLIAEAALFLIGCMIADMQKPDSYGKYTTIQYYMQIFRGCYPFTDARTDAWVHTDTNYLQGFPSEEFGGMRIVHFAYLSLFCTASQPSL